MSANDQYSLNWSNHTTHIKKAFDSLWSGNQFVDVTLSCEGKKINAHKMLLSACSVYFHDLFQDNPCQHPIVILRDVKFDNLLNILKFIYSGEVSVASECFDEFLKTAELLQISGLVDEEARNSMSERDSQPSQSQKQTHVNDSNLEIAKQKEIIRKRPSEVNSVNEVVEKKKKDNEVCLDVQIKQENIVEEDHFVEAKDPLDLEEQHNESTEGDLLQPAPSQKYVDVQDLLNTPSQKYVDVKDLLNETTSTSSTAPVNITENESVLLNDEERSISLTEEAPLIELDDVTQINKNVLNYTARMDAIEKCTKDHTERLTKLEEIANNTYNECIRIRLIMENIERLIGSKELETTNENSNTLPSDTVNLGEMPKFPLNTIEHISQFNAKLTKNVQYYKYFQTTFTRQFGMDGKKDGNKIGRQFVQILFTPYVLTFFSWTGSTRAGEKKSAFNVYTHFLSAFTEVMVKVDSRWSADETNSFFKNKILKHSVQRKTAYEAKIHKKQKLEASLAEKNNPIEIESIESESNLESVISIKEENDSHDDVE